MKSGLHLFDRLAALGSVAILLGLGMLSYYFAQQADRGSPAPARTERTNEPDYFVDRMRALRTDREGRPSVRVEALRTVHHPLDRTVEFERPHLTTLNDLRPTITVTAERGVGPDTGELAELTGNVVVVREPGERQSGMTATTDHATVQIPEKIVRTDARVEMTMGDDRLEGVGMQLDSDGRQLQLDSRVRGRYLQQGVRRGSGAEQSPPPSPSTPGPS